MMNNQPAGSETGIILLEMDKNIVCGKKHRD
jgi:hypothetical protein